MAPADLTIAADPRVGLSPRYYPESQKSDFKTELSRDDEDVTTLYLVLEEGREILRHPDSYLAIPRGSLATN